MSNINYMKELSRLALEVCKRNRNIPICLLKPDLRRQTIIELKGRDDLEQWDKDLIEHGWFTGYDEWKRENANENLDEMFDRLEGERRARERGC